MQSFKVASALTASAVSAAFNGAVSVNKAIIQRQPFIRCVQKKKKYLSQREELFFMMSDICFGKMSKSWVSWLSRA